MKRWYDQAKARMHEQQISQEQMAERMGVTQGAVAHWLNGRRQPKLEVINRMLELLDLPQLSFMEAKEPSITLVKPQFRRVRIKGIAQLSSDGYWDALEAADGWIDIPANDPDAYALRVKGDSMAPAIRNGWIVWCEPEHDLIPGEYVMTCRTDGQCMIAELLFKNVEVVSLMSINPSYGRLTIPCDEIELIHYVGGILPASKIGY